MATSAAGKSLKIKAEGMPAPPVKSLRKASEKPSQRKSRPVPPSGAGGGRFGGPLPDMWQGFEK
eukprot:2825467-Prymnesium_polylepis.1